MSDQPELSSYAARNRQTWDAQSSEYQSKHAAQLAASGGTGWGVWQLPESELRILGDVREKDVLELGCGAAQWSVALHALGARVTGLDNSSVQLEHARALPGGLLAFSMNTPILDLVWPLDSDHPGEQLLLDYWDMHALEAPGEPVEFQLPYGAWIALFREHGFIVEDLIELRPPADATSPIWRGRGAGRWSTSGESGERTPSTRKPRRP
jgi:SAM-dependent methyltransferase